MNHLENSLSEFSHLLENFDEPTPELHYCSHGGELSTLHSRITQDGRYSKVDFNDKGIIGFLQVCELYNAEDFGLELVKTMDGWRFTIEICDTNQTDWRKILGLQIPYEANGLGNAIRVCFFLDQPFK